MVTRQPILPYSKLLIHKKCHKLIKVGCDVSQVRQLEKDFAENGKRETDSFLRPGIGAVSEILGKPPSKICNKYRKHGTGRLAYFDPKQIHFKLKIDLFLHFVARNFQYCQKRPGMSRQLKTRIAFSLFPKAKLF